MLEYEFENTITKTNRMLHLFACNVNPFYIQFSEELLISFVYCGNLSNSILMKLFLGSYDVSQNLLTYGWCVFFLFQMKYVLAQWVQLQQKYVISSSIKYQFSFNFQAFFQLKFGIEFPSQHYFFAVHSL